MRRQAKVLAAVALVLVGIALVARSDGTSDETPGPTTTTTASAQPPPGAPAGDTLALAGPGGVTLLDADAGTRVAEIPGAAAAVSLAAGVAVLVDGVALYMAAPYDGDLVALGRADRVLPSDHPHRVWLMATDGSVNRVREVDRTGEQTVPEIELPNSGDRTVPAAVRGGLLVNRDSAGYLVDRRGESRLLFHGSLVAADHDRVAYLACARLRDCGLHVIDLTTGDDRTYDPPDDHRFGSYSRELGAGSGFSPDGSRLLLPLAGTTIPTRFPVIVDLDTGDIARVRGAMAAGEGTVAWARDGERLFLVSAPFTLSTWQLGDTEPERIELPDGTGPSVHSVVVVPSQPAA